MLQHYPFSNNELSTIGLLVLGAVFVHACFQLSVSVLTLLSSHTIGRRLPNTRLMSLTFWYIVGVVASLALLQIAAIALMRTLMSHDHVLASWVTLTILPVVALLVALFYYRRGQGTKLWLPKSAAEYITGRAKKTRSSVEAFALGTTTTLTELPFAIAPIIVSAYAFQAFPSDWWWRLALGYGLVVGLPLVFVALYLSSGHKLSTVQKWREDAKNFLKWTSAGALLLLTIYIALLQTGATS